MISTEDSDSDWDDLDLCDSNLEQKLKYEAVEVTILNKNTDSNEERNIGSVIIKPVHKQTSQLKASIKSESCEVLKSIPEYEEIENDVITIPLKTDSPEMETLGLDSLEDDDSIRTSPDSVDIFFSDSDDNSPGTDNIGHQYTTPNRQVPGYVTTDREPAVRKKTTVNNKNDIRDRERGSPMLVAKFEPLTDYMEDEGDDWAAMCTDSSGSLEDDSPGKVMTDGYRESRPHPYQGSVLGRGKHSLVGQTRIKSSKKYKSINTANTERRQAQSAEEIAPPAKPELPTILPCKSCEVLRSHNSVQCVEKEARQVITGAKKGSVGCSGTLCNSFLPQTPPAIPEPPTCEACEVSKSHNSMVQCCEGHVICVQCVEKEAKQVITGAKKGSVGCSVTLCNSSIPQSELRKALTSFVLDLLEESWKKETLEAIENMKDGVTCPGCGYSGVLETAIKNFKCNRCNKTYCRLCEMEWSLKQHDLCVKMVRKVSEATGHTINIPAHWTLSTDTETEMGYSVVKLDNMCQEYLDIVAMFFKSLPRAQHTVTTIYRVQNQRLWEKYNLFRTHLVQDIGDLHINESRLFHGTHTDVIDSICKEGFDWRLSGKHGTNYGHGTYFAKDSSYSSRYSSRHSGKWFQQKGNNSQQKGNNSAPSPSFPPSYTQHVRFNVLTGEPPTNPNINTGTAGSSGSQPQTIPKINTGISGSAGSKAIQTLLNAQHKNSLNNCARINCQNPIYGKEVNKIRAATTLVHSTPTVSSASASPASAPSVLSPSAPSVSPASAPSASQAFASSVSPTSLSGMNSGCFIFTATPSGTVAKTKNPCGPPPTISLKSKRDSSSSSSNAVPSSSNVSASAWPPSIFSNGSSGSGPPSGFVNLVSTASSSSMIPPPWPAVTTNIPSVFGGAAGFIAKQTLPPPNIPPSTGANFFLQPKTGSSSSSSSSTTRWPDRENYMYMFVARVLVGKKCRGSSDMRRPDKGTHTAVDIVDHSSIYVVFESGQCYPEYLVEYIKR